jgi:hypothetical protein
MKVLTYLDPLSVAKVAALLGILWAILGWAMGGIVISLLAQGGQDVSDLPPGFSLGGLLSSMIGGFIGGALSGYLGSHAYNFLARKVGGIRAEVMEV